MSAAAARGGDRWPEWRGASGQGHADAVDVPVSWSSSQQIAWKTPIPGRGWSTPVIENGVAWVTTAIDVPASPEDAERRRKLSTNPQPVTISASVSLRAVGVDVRTGRIMRDMELFGETEPQMVHVENSYATPTPIIEDGRLYCHFGPCGMGCVDVRTGQVQWTSRDLFRVAHENGPGSSPVLWRNRLIVHCDGIDQQYVVALDKQTGKQLWKTMRSGELNSNPQMRKSYATPLVADVHGQPQLISPAADWVYGYDPETGRELWRLNYGQLGFSNAGRPISQGDRFFITTGYTKAQLLAFRIEHRNGQFHPVMDWQFQKQVPNVSSPILVGNEIFFASDNGIATCIDAATGELQWTERIGQRYWASPIHAEGRLYFFDRDGVGTVIAADRKYHLHAVNKLSGTVFASAAAIDGMLLVRTDEALYGIQ